MKVIMRLNAESSSRPLTPSPLCEGGGGVAKRTSVISQSYKAYLRYVFRVEGNSAPPPLLKGGEGVRGRDGTFGI